MADGTKITDFMLIVAFSGAIVALGANELRGRYVERSRGPGIDQAQLVNELRGDLESRHVGFSQETAEEAVKRRETSDERKSLYHRLKDEYYSEE